MSKAQAALKPYEETLSSLPADFTPLSRQPEAGKDVVYLANPVPYDQQEASAFASAASAIGWTSQTVNYDGSVEDLNSKFQQVIAASPKPAVIVLNGYPIAAIKQSVDAAEAAGILVIDSAISDVPTGTAGFAASADGPETYEATGALEANWVLQDSGCNANVIMFTLAYPIFESLSSGFETTLRDGCSACTYEYQKLPMNAAGTPAATEAIVSAIQADPSVKYIATVGDLTQGLQPALTQAGITGVKIFGLAPAAPNYEDLKSGNEGMWVSKSPSVMGWVALDAALRVLDSGKPFTGFVSPLAMLTKDNVPADADPSTAFPTDYESLFKTLWQVD